MSLPALLPLRAVIVDDEPLARARLRRLLGAEPAVTVVAECATGEEAAAVIAATRPHVVLLDIQMPAGDGFGVLDRLPPSAQPLVIFVTAYAEHAVRAFDAQALDYLVKPVSAERLGRALGRARQRLAPPALARETTTAGERLTIPDGSKIHLVATADIDYVTAQANYVEIHAGARSYLLRETMNGLEARLDPRHFLRIHRSRLVRLDRIQDVEPIGSGQYVVRLKSGTVLTSGRHYRLRLRRAIGVAVQPLPEDLQP